MVPIWGWQDPGGPHVGPMNFAILDNMLLWTTCEKAMKISTLVIYSCYLMSFYTWGLQQNGWYFTNNDNINNSCRCPECTKKYTHSSIYDPYIKALILWGLVMSNWTHWCLTVFIKLKSVLVMTWCLYSTNELPKPKLTYCEIQVKFKSIYFFFHGNAFENVCKISFSLSLKLILQTFSNAITPPKIFKCNNS